MPSDGSFARSWVENLEREVREGEEEKAGLRGSMAAATSQLAVKNRELGELRKKLRSSETAAAEKRGMGEKMMKKLQEEIENLKSEKEAAEAQCVEFGNVVLEFERELQRSCDETHSLQAQCEGLKRQLVSAQQGVGQTEAEAVRAIEQQVRGVSAELDTTRAQLETERYAKDTLKKLLKEKDMQGLVISAKSQEMKQKRGAERARHGNEVR